MKVTELYRQQTSIGNFNNSNFDEMIIRPDYDPESENEADFKSVEMSKDQGNANRKFGKHHTILVMHKYERLKDRNRDNAILKE